MKKSDTMESAISCYYEKSMLVLIHEELVKKMNGVAIKLADKIMEKYKVTQTFTKKVGIKKDKLILVTTLELI